MIWLEQSTAASVRVVQPHDWYADGATPVAAVSYDGAGASLNASHSVTQGVARELKSGTYGRDQTDPCLVTVDSAAGHAKADFDRGDEVVIGIKAAADFDRDLRERGIVNRWKWASGADSDLELMHELAEQFDSATTWYIWNCVHEVAFTATDTADLLRAGRLVLTYTRADDVTYKQALLFDVVQHVPKLTLTELGLKRRYPETFNSLHSLVEREGQGTIYLHLHAAWDWVMEDVVRKGVRPEMVVDHTVWDEPVAQRALWYAARNNVIPGDEDPLGWRKECKTEYFAARKRAVGRITWYDEDQDAVPDSAELDRVGFNVSKAVM